MQKTFCLPETSIRILVHLTIGCLLYLELLKKVLDEHDLTDKPGQIYTCDETGMPFDARPLNVVTSKKEKKVRSRTSGNKKSQYLARCMALVRRGG